MAEVIEAVEALEQKDTSSLGAGALVFVGGMALAAASFLVEHYVIKSLKKG